MNTLTVYRASAGSGKTFTLAVQYITLLVENPHAYRHTLAVTFTNKATEEMKMRILSQLYGISVGLNESKPYLECVKQLSGLEEKTIIANAGYALRELIHHYSYFRVETIDAFFQTVLRNLARELELTANLRIELNDEQVEQQAVDQLIEDLNDSSLLLSWILDYIQENIDDDKSWNVIAQIKQFGRNILKDYYKKNRQKIKEVFEDNDFFKQYTGQLRAISKHAEEQMKACGDTFFKCIADNGFDITDFSKGASGVCGYFLKLQSGDFTDDERVFNSTAQGASENPEKWVVKKKAIVGEPIYDLVCSTLQEMLITTERKRKQQSRLFKSVSLTLKHINQLRLLDSIGDKVEELNLELNRFMLSDTQTLLKSMIGENDSPFIFEKIGAQLHNIMIDEFQDTGSVQWENFKVLLLETMRHDSNNLIVGDVKQSIYRWRSGDWRLLNDIEEQFKEHEITIKPLQVNRRSERNIITFNNTFFQEAVRQEYEQLKQDIGDEAELLQKAYADVIQEIPSDKKEVGIVEVELLPNTPEYEEETHKKIADKVQHLLDNGVREN
ncbi:MAG: UvrD-helicase domain-containing protein, partial [Segatella salivae]